MNRLGRTGGWLGVTCLLAAGIKATLPVGAATDSMDLLVNKWNRFEQTFQSTVPYPNPLADITLTVAFISPLGETTKVYGFWDGGETWRVRFSPDLPGKWTFRTACSDVANPGLHDVTGEFVCTAAAGESRFSLHGPVRMALDHSHLVHADGTPFFWLADTVWNGVRLAKQDDWDLYGQARAWQRFTVAQWIAVPGGNTGQPAAYTGGKSITINLDFFKQMDGKVESLCRAGLVNAIVPLWEFSPSTGDTRNVLPEDQAIVLLRYLLARWGAYDVVWVIACEGGSLGGNVGRWKRIGQAVFGKVAHAPVILYAGDTYWTLDEFRNEPWVGLLGYKSGPEITDETSQWLVAGPISKDWKKEPFHPLINVDPPIESAAGGFSRNPSSPEAIRRVIYWSLLNAPPAGVSYNAEGISDWQTEAGVATGNAAGKSLAPWQKALFLPAGKQMENVAAIFESLEFWRLRPTPELLVNQPGRSSPGRFIAAARTESRDMALIYVPEDRTVELVAGALPELPVAVWIDPRTDERTRTAAAVTGETFKFTTPGPGDWLLLIKTLKK